MSDMVARRRAVGVSDWHRRERWEHEALRPGHGTPSVHTDCGMQRHIPSSRKAMRTPSSAHACAYDGGASTMDGATRVDEPADRELVPVACGDMCCCWNTCCGWV